MARAFPNSFVFPRDPENELEIDFNISGRVGEDIELSLGDNDNNTLRLETRNGSSAAWLVLGEGLDREGVTGPSGVRASLSCIRSGAGDTDPGYVIPINVR